MLENKFQGQLPSSRMRHRRSKNQFDLSRYAPFPPTFRTTFAGRMLFTVRDATRASRTPVACNRNGGGPPSSPFGFSVSCIDLFKSRCSDRKEKKWPVRKENAEYLVVEEFIDQDAVEIRLYRLEYR